MSSMEAYVLVQTERSAEPIALVLRGVPGVAFAHDLHGPYDAIALAHAGGDSGSLDGTLQSIRDLPGVIRAIAAPLIRPSVAVRNGAAA